jgi:argininosuccinate lyase
MRANGTVLWRGRLAAAMHPRIQKFLSSFAEDAALVDIDCDVCEAHVLALAKEGFFRPRELKRVMRAYERARALARARIKRTGGV